MNKEKVYQSWEHIGAYALHLLTSKSKYAIHSPHVFEFCTKVLPHQASAWGKKVEAYRKFLTKDHTLISFPDFGARGQGGAIREVQLSHLAKMAARKYRAGELLYRLCQFYQIKRGLEFGTNLGIGTMYQMGAVAEAQFITMEGAPAIADYASNTFQHFELSPQLMVGEFSNILQRQLSLEKFRPDYVFLDGNHQYQATIDYMNQLLPHMAENAMIVLDDIHWSKGMHKAWMEIVQMPQVSVSIDLYMMGICWVKKKQAKEHFKLRFRF